MFRALTSLPALAAPQCRFGGRYLLMMVMMMFRTILFVPFIHPYHPGGQLPNDQDLTPVQKAYIHCEKSIADGIGVWA